MKKYNLIIIILSAIVVSTLPFAIGYYITFEKNNVSEEKVILIYNHYTYDNVIGEIVESGGLKNKKSFLRAAKISKFKKHFEAGRYLLRKGLSNKEIIRIISNKWETPFRFVMKSHIRTLDDVALFLWKNFEADFAQFANTLSDSTLIAELGFNEKTIIGMFIPNTYEIYWTSAPENILRRFKREYEKFWNESRTELAKAIGLNRNEVMTLASIVSSETNNEKEMPRIAGVYINRLHRKIPLQACPTIIYAYKDIEPGIKRVLNRHLKIDSPYNTYTHMGLPPGPINIPPIKAIDAVLNYEKSNYIYFCVKPEFDGTHNFASTYSEHRKNFNAYQKALNKKTLL